MMIWITTDQSIIVKNSMSSPGCYLYLLKHLKTSLVITTEFSN